VLYRKVDSGWTATVLYTSLRSFQMCLSASTEMFTLLLSRTMPWNRVPHATSLNSSDRNRE